MTTIETTNNFRPPQYSGQRRATAVTAYNESSDHHTKIIGPEGSPLPRTARQAIKAWYSTHPKTFCPVIGQSICPLKGCENPAIRNDPRCNIELKQAQAEARPAETAGLDELRGWIYDLRDSPDHRRWIVNFGYNAALLDDFRQLIPASGRRFDPETREWWVAKEYDPVLRTLFVNYDRFVSARYQWLKARRMEKATS